MQIRSPHTRCMHLAKKITRRRRRKSWIESEIIKRKADFHFQFPLVRDRGSISNMMQKHNDGWVIWKTKASRETPAIKSDIVRGRCMGKGTKLHFERGKRRVFPVGMDYMCDVVWNDIYFFPFKKSFFLYRLYVLNKLIFCFSLVRKRNRKKFLLKHWN